MNQTGIPKSFQGLAFLMLVGLLALTLQAGTNISNSSNTASWAPRLVVDSAGNVHAIWVELYSSTSGDIFYSKMTASSQSWSTPLNISQSQKVRSTIDQSCHMCDIDGDGSNNIYAVWAETPDVKMRVLTGSGWDSTFTLGSGTGCDAPYVSVDGGGNIFASWWGGYRIYSRARINGSWESTRQVSDGTASKMADIGVGSNSAYIVYMKKLPQDYRLAWSRRDKTLNASWSSPALIYDGPECQKNPCVKLDTSDTIHVVWTDEALDGVRTPRYVYNSGSGFSSQVSIGDSTLIHYPSMSVRGTNVYACWQYGGWGGGNAIRFNRKISGSWAGEDSVPSSSGCTYGDIDADSSGGLHFVFDSSGEIFYSTETGGGGGGGGGGGTTPPPPPPPNVPPTADFNYSTSNYWAPAEIEFDGTLSVDPDGRVASWDWQFGDGGMGSGGHIHHTYYGRGTYNIKLTVSDNSGATSSKIKSITIEGLYAPKNVQAAYSLDESLFQSRWVAKVTWEANPDNANHGYTISKYEVFRREADSSNDNWNFIHEHVVADGGSLEYMDTDAQAENKFEYAVRAKDSAGHASNYAVSGQGSPDIADEIGGDRPGKDTRVPVDRSQKQRKK